MRPSIRAALVACLALLLLPAASSAQSKAAQGSTLALPANYAYDCATRWLPAIAPPQDHEPNYVGPSTCGLYNNGTSIDDTHIVPGTGKITSARVRSGAGPAPISIMVARMYTGADPESGMPTTTCCLGLHESAVVTPTPDAVTEIPLADLRVEVQPYDPQTKKVGWHDVVVVNVHGPGSLPISDLGTHPAIGPASLPSMSQAFPKAEKGANAPFGYTAPGFEILMNYSWCADGATRQTCGKAGTPPPAGTPGAPGTPAPTTPGTPAADAAKLVSISSRRLALKGRSVPVKVACAKGAACKGTVRLRTKTKKPVVLGKKALKIAAGRTATVKVPLSARSRKRIGRKGVSVSVQVDLGGGRVVSRGVILRRK